MLNGEIDQMATGSAWDVVILGSGIAGLSAALAAHELGLRPIVLEKARTLGGGTIHSYGLIWVGLNHLAEAAG
jgi:3-oxosteroid 1-dehydrogenase